MFSLFFLYYEIKLITNITLLFYIIDVNIMSKNKYLIELMRESIGFHERNTYRGQHQHSVKGCFRSVAVLIHFCQHETHLNGIKASVKTRNYLFSVVQLGDCPRHLDVPRWKSVTVIQLLFGLLMAMPLVHIILIYNHYANQWNITEV